MESVFVAISRHCLHLLSLVLHLHVAQSRCVMQYLRNVAPVLSNFQLLVVLDDRDDALPMVPADLFGSQAPRLVHVRLLNVALPLSRNFSAFISVYNLFLAYDRRSVPMESPNIFEYFPSLRMVTLEGEISLWSPIYRLSTTWPPLLVAGFNLASGNSLTCPLDILPLHRVPHIELWHPYPNDVEAVYNHLGGPLQLAFTLPISRDTNRLVVHFVTADSRITRSITHNLAHLLYPGFLYELLNSKDEATRIISLTLPLKLVDRLLSALPPLPNVAELRLLISPGDIWPKTQLELPALQRLICCASPPDGRLCIMADQLTQFARASMERNLPLQLALENISVQDCACALNACFGHILHNPQSAWKIPIDRILPRVYADIPEPPV
ncbi:hypothetical protein AURDEDRAFT_184334 [Auricularia subglabra TFB-10046 SS5]|nr:hypothetical protein AURDEDRAFT_184334 [Auricularia subglabra TFB-10046 SS5]